MFGTAFGHGKKLRASLSSSGIFGGKVRHGKGKMGYAHKDVSGAYFHEGDCGQDL